MPLFVRIAWRNVTRNRRRTLITLGAISSGLAAIIVFFGLSNGFYNQWVNHSVRVFTGHIVVLAKGYRAEKNLNRSIQDVAGLEAQLSDVNGLEAMAPRIHVNGLVSTPRHSGVALIRGVDPEREEAISGLAESMVKGAYFGDASDGARQILIGAKMAERLQVDIGEKIVLMVQAADGSIGAELFRLRGVFRLGAIDIDRRLVIIPLRDAQDLAVLGSKITEMVLMLDSPGAVAPAAAALSGQLRDSGYEVWTWETLMPEVKEMIGLSSVFNYLVLIIILIVVSLGILNTMLMSIMERTREFGIMRAVGTTPLQIIGLVMLEATVLGLLGMLLGVSLGLGIIGVLEINGIDLSQWSGAMELIASLRPVIYPAARLDNVAVAALAAFAATLLAAIYPALRASRLKPVTAIRSV